MDLYDDLLAILFLKVQRFKGSKVQTKSQSGKFFWKSRMKSLLVVFILFLLINSINANKINKNTSLDSQNVLWIEGGLFSAEDDWRSRFWPPNRWTDLSRLTWALSISSNNNRNSTLSLVWFPAISWNDVGYSPTVENRVYCCTQDLVDLKKCKDIGKPIINSKKYLNGAKPWTDYIEFNSINTSKSGILDSTLTDWYYFGVMNCESTESLNLNLEINWINPYGELPGELWGLIPLYWVICLSYVAVTIWWTIKMLIHRNVLMELQIWIYAVLICGLFESTATFRSIRKYNITGIAISDTYVIGAGSLLNAGKQTLFRILMLSISSGWGILKPKLSKDEYSFQKKFSILYFLVSWIVNSVLPVTSSRYDGFFSKSSKLFFIASLAVLDTFFYWRLLNHLSATFKALKVKNNNNTSKKSPKLLLYRRFLILLILAAISSIAMILFQSFAERGPSFESKHSWWYFSWWFDSGFWAILYFSVLFLSAFLLKPVRNNTRYAPAVLEDASFLDNVESNIELETKSLTPSQVKKKQKSKNKIKSKIMKKKIKAEFAILDNDSDDEILESKQH